MLNFLYRNYIESKGVFFNGKDVKGLYNEKESQEWYKKTSQNFKKIGLRRHLNRIVDIWLPIGKGVDENGIKVDEDTSLSDFVVTEKLETRLVYIVNQILDEYYYGKDMCFHKRDTKKALKGEHFGTIFTMREFIDGIFRISPVKIRTAVEKETQNVQFADWGIGMNVSDSEFLYNGQKYTTNFYGLYGSIFRKTMNPNSNFGGSTLQSRQRDLFINRGRITVVMAGRSMGKSMSSTAFTATYLFKELCMDFEKNRPFLIVYAGMSRDTNLQVVQYIKGMATALSKNKNVIRRVAQEQTLIFFDGHNERRVKFVSQGQEGGGFRGLRPHLVILDEAARLDEEMYTIAAGTAEAQIILISTIKQTDKRNWFYKLYLDAVKRQRYYKKPEDVIPELWIKYGLHKIKNQEEFIKAIDSGVIEKIRMDLRKERPIVGLKYTIDEAEYLSDEQRVMMVEGLMQKSEADALAEFYCEYSDGAEVFNTEGLLESSMPLSFDRIALGFDEAEEHDNPAVTIVGILGKRTYVLHSEILDKSDHVMRYARINELMSEFQRKTSYPILFGMDLTRTRGVGLREVSAFVREPDFPIDYTSSQQGAEIKRKWPYYLIGKKGIVVLCQDQFFKPGSIIFNGDLDVEGGLIEEISNFKIGYKGKIEGQKKKADDQVNAMMVALLCLFYGYIKDKFTPLEIAGGGSREERIYAIEAEEIARKAMEQYEKNISEVMSDRW